MNVLIVEDDENKRGQLRQFLARQLPQLAIQEEKSLQSGLKHVRNCAPDLILLDMTLPTYDSGPDEPGGQTHIFGGSELLRQLDRFDIEVPVIVVTQFETFGHGRLSKDLTQLDRELKAEHAKLYRGMVYYHAAIHGWEDKLRSLIQEVLRLS